MRKRIYEIIEKAEGQDKLSAAYDYFMIVVIILSLIPLAFKEETQFFYVLDKIKHLVIPHHFFVLDKIIHK